MVDKVKVARHNIIPVTPYNLHHLTQFKVTWNSSSYRDKTDLMDRFVCTLQGRVNVVKDRNPLPLDEVSQIGVAPL